MNRRDMFGFRSFGSFNLETGTYNGSLLRTLEYDEVRRRDGKLSLFSFNVHCNRLGKNRLPLAVGQRNSDECLIEGT